MATKKSKKKSIDLSLLERFTKLENQDFKMTKIKSKREGSMVGVGQYEVGDFSLMELSLKGAPDAVGGFITGSGFSYLRTSPILAITEHDEDSTTFETEGGFYKVEKFPPARPKEDRPCHNPECGVITPIEKLEMKMGGLLCPECRTIIYQPYVDEEFFDERARRYKEEAEADKQEGDL